MVKVASGLDFFNYFDFPPGQYHSTIVPHIPLYIKDDIFFFRN